MAGIFDFPGGDVEPAAPGTDTSFIGMLERWREARRQKVATEEAERLSKTQAEEEDQWFAALEKQRKNIGYGPETTKEYMGEEFIDYTPTPEREKGGIESFLNSLGIEPGEKNPFLRDLGLLMATRKPGPLSFIAEPLKGAVELETSRGSAASKAAIEYAKIGATMAKTKAAQQKARLDRKFKYKELDAKMVHDAMKDAYNFYSGDMGVPLGDAQTVERKVKLRAYESLKSQGYSDKDIESKLGITATGKRISGAWSPPGALAK